MDLPANHATTQNHAALTLPDVLTELDLLPPMPDVSLLLDEPSHLANGLELGRSKVGRNEDITLSDHNTQLLSDDIELGRNAPEEAAGLEDEELILDFGFGNETGNAIDDTSVHVGREAPPPKPFDEDMDYNLKMVHGDDVAFHQQRTDSPLDEETDIVQQDLRDETPLLDMDADIDLGQHPDQNLEQLLISDVPGLERSPEDRHERDSMSPLSDLRPSEERELEEEYNRNLDLEIYESEQQEDEAIQQQSRLARKGKLLQPDSATTLPSSHIRHMQQDRSRILKPTSLLPRDSVLLTLIEMQQNGDFVTNILGDGLGRGWAPELRDVFSLEVVRKSGNLKRKHDNDVANIDTEVQIASSDSGKRPRIEFEADGMERIPEDDLTIMPDVSRVTDGEVIDIPADQEVRHDIEEALLRSPIEEEEGEELEQQRQEAEEEVEEERASPLANDAFDDTVAPLVHPADNGPVALGTQHAVHLLRDCFGPDIADSSSQRSKASVLFQELLPERRTTKADATKMFFEVLVLATKDAVKVEQDSDALGGPIRVRGRRGLWGAWAERDAEGEIAEQDEPLAVAQEVSVEA